MILNKKEAYIGGVSKWYDMYTMEGASMSSDLFLAVKYDVCWIDETHKNLFG